MSRNVKLSVALLLVFVLAGGGFLVYNRANSTDEAVAASEPVNAEVLSRPDSRRLQTAPDGKVTVVEFLDFECEACGKAYPTIERLRKEYAGRVTFVVRYFPLKSHFNAERAARAVEAAAQQGRFEQMYQRMYDTQKEWGEQQVPMDDRFRGYAADLGLLMGQWNATYAAAATLDRVKADIADGQTLDVDSTPTIFVNGTRHEDVTYEELTKDLDAALAS